MSEAPETPNPEKWAHLRFSVVGMLLAGSPPRGELGPEIEKLAARQWVHPVTGKRTRFAASTIERWYYQARNARKDPVGALRRKVRKDQGRHRRVSDRLVSVLLAQYEAQKSWSRRLHYDNL
ncbi:MAG: IS481 family transposase, partial [Candidatus Thermoplasmatota archaeon]